MWFLQSTIFFTIFVTGLEAHGRLMDPPARNAMWRLGFPNPVNYNDNEVYCGGYGVQHTAEVNGKCGPCGDDYRKKEPRDHESQGLYGNGIIGRRYTVGQRITVEVELTTNHQGYFTMKLCPINDKSKPSTDECFDQYPLLTAEGNSTEYHIPEGTPKVAVIKYDLMLPPGLVCQQCVMQWTYYTGNTWGLCPDGEEAMGCGPQETFRNCADITILSSTGAVPPGASFTEKLYSQGVFDRASSYADFPYAIYVNDPIEGRKPFVVRSQVCIPTSAFEKDPYAEHWCKVNCLRYPPNCPKNKCSCISDCRATGILAGIEGTDVYCLRNCLRLPQDNCPKDRCECFGETNNKDSIFGDQLLEEEPEEAQETTTQEQ